MCLSLIRVTRQHHFHKPKISHKTVLHSSTVPKSPLCDTNSIEKFDFHFSWISKLKQKICCRFVIDSITHKNDRNSLLNFRLTIFHSSKIVSFVYALVLTSLQFSTRKNAEIANIKLKRNKKYLARWSRKLFTVNRIRMQIPSTQSKSIIHGFASIFTNVDLFRILWSQNRPKSTSDKSIMSLSVTNLCLCFASSSVIRSSDKNKNISILSTAFLASVMQFPIDVDVFSV